MLQLDTEVFLAPAKDRGNHLGEATHAALGGTMNKNHLTASGHLGWLARQWVGVINRYLLSLIAPHAT